MSRRIHVVGLLSAALLAGGCFGHDYRSKPRVGVVDGNPIVQMTPPGAFASISDPHFVAVRDHADPPFRGENVVGISLATPPRMYPVGLLDSYEVVNDEVGGVPYVVARCALTDLVAAFDRRVAGRTLTFENSGALWRDMLVLRDRETGTYWTPSTGKALAGPLEGERLAGLPAPLTTADAWEELLPDTVCLETGDLTAVSLRLRLYRASSWEGVSGAKTRDLRYKPKERLFFVAEGGETVAFTAAEVRQRKTLSATLAGRPLTIEWDAALRTPRAYTPDGAVRRERPVVPMYWFALVRHFATVRTPARSAGSP